MLGLTHVRRRPQFLYSFADHLCNSIFTLPATAHAMRVVSSQEGEQAMNKQDIGMDCL